VATTMLAYPAVYSFTLGVTVGHPASDTYSTSAVAYTNAITAVSVVEYQAPYPPPSSVPPTPPQQFVCQYTGGNNNAGTKCPFSSNFIWKCSSLSLLSYTFISST
jgi:hypothetical protein